MRASRLSRGTRWLVVVSAVALGPATTARAETSSGANVTARDYAVQIALGENHACVLFADGNVRCWGSNAVGQLGLGTIVAPNDKVGDDETLAALPAVDLGLGRTALQIAAGDNYTCAVLDDGNVRCWGSNAVGQLGLGTIVAPNDKVGDDETPGSVAPVDLGVGRTAVAISAGGPALLSPHHVCALLDDNSVRCWGDNGYGQLGLGDNVAPLNRVGDDETPGSVAPVDLGVGRIAVALASNTTGSCALLDTGDVRCWGDNALTGELGLGTVAAPLDLVGDDETPGSLAPIDLGAGRTATAIAGGWLHNCAILDDGNVRCWGNGANGQLGYAATANVGDDEVPGSAGPVNLGVGRTAVAIAAGTGHSCAILDDGDVRCWGQNNVGQLGYGNTTQIGDTETPDTAGPVNLGAGRSALAIEGGSHATCVILDDGDVRCWGQNNLGQLGLGTVAAPLNNVGDDETPDTIAVLDFGGAAVVDAATSDLPDTSVCETDGEGASMPLAPILSPVQPYGYAIDYSTADGTATAGSDYDASTGTITITPGETEVLGGVFGAGDDLIEPNETYTVTATHKGVAVAVATATILDDDGKTCDGLLPEALSGGAAFDLEGDHDSELLVGAGGEDVGSRLDAGVFHVLWGKKSGPDATNNVALSQNSPGVPDSSETGDGFGVVTAGGDFNGDGLGDLAVAAPFEDLGAAPDAGAVHVFYGSSAGLKLKGSQFFTQNTKYVPDVAEANDRFGGALASGDFNGDGKDDLAIGATESVGARVGAGSVTVLYGSSKGLVAKASKAFTQNTKGVPDASESGDAFGTSLAAGDVNGDGKDDLAVGAFREDVGAIVDAGSLTVFRGSKYGVTPKGVKAFTQASAAVADDPEAGDRFGESLAAGDANADGKAEVVVGVPGEMLGAADEAGAVHVLRGSSTGASASGSAFVTQNLFAPDASEAGDRFGADVASGDVNGDGKAELVAGSPGERLSGKAEAGAVYVLYNFAPTGLAFVSQVWTQDSAGIADAVEAWDQFGACVDLVDLTGDRRAELVVGVPGEDVGATADAGASHVLRGSPGGVLGPGSKLWTQDSPGIADDSQRGDRFGAD